MTISVRFLSTSILLGALAACSSARTPAAGPAGPAGVPSATAARITDPSAQLAESRDGVVAAATPDAAAAGARVLAEGGNAVDAAVALGRPLAGHLPPDPPHRVRLPAPQPPRPPRLLPAPRH